MIQLPTDQAPLFGIAAERLWVLTQLVPNSPALAVAHALRTPRALEPRELTAVVESLRARHPGLALRFVAEGERPRAELAGRALVSVRTIGTAEGLAASARIEARAEARRGFDLFRGPLLRITQIRAADGVGLVLVAHRALCDRAVLARLGEEVLALIEGRALSAPGDARELAAEERSFVASSAAAEHIACVKARLAGHDLSLDLPMDRARAEQRSLVSETASFELSAGVVTRVDALARELGITRADVLASALTLLFARYARQRDLVLGETLAPDEAAPFCLAERAHTAVVRAELTDDLSIRELFTRIARARSEAAHDALVPFESLLETLSPKRDPSRSPIFQVELGFRRAHPSELDVDAGGLETDLAVTFVEQGAQLRVLVAYSTELFDAGTVSRMAGHFTALVARIVERSEAKAFGVPLVTIQEQAALLAPARAVERWSGTPCLHRWVEARAREQPEAVAVRSGDVALRYGELNARANRLARVLRAKGVRRDERVVVCMERSEQLICALLAVLKAGGAYVPIEPTNPKDRIAFVLEDARAKVALTERSVADNVQGAGAELVFVDELSALSDQPSDDLDASEDDPTQLAYVIYTSGSTGKPKGCLIEHRHVVRLFQATEAWFGFGARDVWTMFHSVAFDFSVWEIWGALVYGGSVVVVPQSITRSPEDFVALCAREGVTVLNQTPSAFRQFITAEASYPKDALALRFVIFGGEALELESLRPWFDKHGDERPELVNMYGITETTVHVTYRPIREPDLALGASSVIGVPIPDLYVLLLDEQQNLVPVGVPGEIFVGGAGVARGYLERPELAAERFIADPFIPGARLYRSGDLARWLANGDLDYLGRIDHQVKIRGFRIETGEIEAVLRRSGLVRDVAVIAHKLKSEVILAAYVVSDASPAELRTAVRRDVPEYMVPAVFVRVAEIPLTGNGKVDRRALPEPKEEAGAAAEVRVLPASELEQQIARVWCEVLSRSEVGADESFFDLGGNSLRVVAVGKRLKELYGLDVPVARLFQHLTIRSLAQHLAGSAKKPGSEVERARKERSRGGDAEPIAIVGMAGRFPGAADVASLWKNLCEGVEAVTRFRPEDLDAHVPDEERTDPAYVFARPILADADCFDAELFGVPPSEAEVMDPQQRVLLEVAWATLEDAGCDPARCDGLIGVYCGEYNDTYYTSNVLTRPDVIERVGAFVAMVGNEKDFVATRIAHRLDLKGPAVSVHTACSTSLVSVAQAFFALRTHQCDLALAGGVAITFPQRQGHVYSDGGMLCADGHCRPFDASATGTMFGDGAAMVALKRLSDALADGDHVYAVIKGAAINNDGGHKMSFSAPSVEGQAQVIAAAQAVADVSPDSVSYVETHGTATPLGDPIEMEALTQAFRAGTERRQFCGVGSIKSNLGHLTAAAGATGVIKTALALEHELIPKTVNFETPSPRIDFAASPFFVVGEHRPWPRGSEPRRAGVSSFGVGGTNAHVVLEEAPLDAREPAPLGPELLVLSARTEQALARASERLAQHLTDHPHTPLSDVAYTLSVGRRAFEHRRTLVAASVAEAFEALKKPSARPQAAQARRATPEIVFVFPGQGAQHAGMGRGLHRTEPVFRRAVDRCAELLLPVLGQDLRDALFAPEDDPRAHALLRETRFTQPALFTLGYALAELYASFGVRPARMLGHSVGEFVAAHVAGVMSLEDALTLVAERGRLMQSMPRGAMLSVRASAERIAAMLNGAVQIAAVNAPNLCVVAGPEEAIEALTVRLEGMGIATSKLHTSHAFHSAMMDAAVEPFLSQVQRVRLSAPSLPIVSTVTGKQLRDEEAQDPMYWAQHLRATVRFADAVREVWSEPTRVLVELGPRNGATQLARQSATDLERQLAVPSLDGKTDEGEQRAFLSALGVLFAHGVEVDLAARFERGRARRVPLPTYAFERRRFYLEPGSRDSAQAPLPERAAASSLGPTPAPAVPPLGVSATAEALVAEQLRLMQLQLEILAQAGGTLPSEAE